VAGARSPRRRQPQPGNPSEDRPPTTGNAAPEYVFGRHAAEEALRGQRSVRRLLLAGSAHGPDLAGLRQLASERGVAVELVDRTRLDQLAGPLHHQGVAAQVSPFPYRRLADLIGRQAQSAPLLLALDRLQDPQNLGTLLRTALATGVDGLLLPEHRSVDVTPAVVRASAGAIEHLPVARVTNLARALAELKAHGLWIYGLDVHATQPFWEIDWRGPSAVVVGAEGPGLGQLVRATCDVLVTVPMQAAGPESLNAAVAGSLVLYEAFRQRQAAQATLGSVSAAGSFSTT
jgi:23S rRNA (guanosine2251-2'-O)-methyltransferase